MTLRPPLAGISRRVAITLLGASLATPAIGGTAASNIRVIWPWVRATRQHDTKAFMTIINENPFDDALVHIGSPWAEKCSLRRAEWKGFNMTVRDVDHLVVPASSRIELKPGGIWIDVRLARAAVKGQAMPFTLKFAQAGRVEIQAEITSRMLGGSANSP